jgi:hypothetical protein
MDTNEYALRRHFGHDAKSGAQRSKLLWRKEKCLDDEIDWWGERPREPLSPISALFQ